MTPNKYINYHYEFFIIELCNIDNIFSISHLFVNYLIKTVNYKIDPELSNL